MIELIPIDKNENPKKIGRNNVAFVEFMIQVKLDINKAIEGINNHNQDPAKELVTEPVCADTKSLEIKIKQLESTIKSNRQESGHKLDVLEQKINKLINMKEK